MMRRRAPFVKMPGDGRARFNDTELTQSFDYGTTATRPSRRQIVNAAAQAAGIPGSGGTTGALCCGDALTGGGTGVGTSTSGTGGTDSTLAGKVAGMKASLTSVSATLTQQVVFNNDYNTLFSDIYSQTGYTPPIDIPTQDGTSGGGV